MAYCGLDCAQCEAYLATKAKNMEKLAELGQKWSPPGEAFSAEEMLCYGCTQDEKIFQWCQECTVRSCARDRQVINCGYCADYPCDEVKKPLEKNPEAKERLDVIQQQEFSQ